MRVPIPLDVLLAMSLALALLGCPRTGIMLLAGFHCLLRQDELGRLQRRHLILPRDGNLFGQAVVTITAPKPPTEVQRYRL